MKTHTRLKGFTIVELLVVIVVIGILATITITAYNGFTSKAQDARRVSNMNQFKKQIEQSYVENGYYPTCGGNISCTSTGYAGNIMLLVSPPPQPDAYNVNGSWGLYYARGYKRSGPNTYTFTSSDQDYVIATRLETGRVPTFSGWNNVTLNYLDGN